MTKPFDWKLANKSLAYLTDLLNICRDILWKMGVGFEIVEWLTGEGKNYFVENHMKPLGNEYLRTHRVRVLSKTIIEVNLSAPPDFPHNETEIESQTGSGWVKVEKRDDALFVNDRKVVLYLSERQKDTTRRGGHGGPELRQELSGKPVLHPSIMDALLTYPHLIPEDWMSWKNRGGIFFWAVIFYNAHHYYPSVRYFYFNGSKWHFDHKPLYSSLGNQFDDHMPAAVLEEADK